jgi:chemotaxis protein CheD
MAERPEAPLFLQPAQMVIAEAPARVKTVLGSCVAISMRAPGLGLASMAHCILPSAPRVPGALPREEALKYVDTAIELMLTEMAGRGAAAGDLEVKLFGGAESSALGGRHPFQVGRRNVEMAERSLAARGLLPVSTGTGGWRGRVIELDCATGGVTVRTLPLSGAGVGSQP